MSRTRNTSPIEDLALLPWWLTLAAGLGIWVWRKSHPPVLHGASPQDLKPIIAAFFLMMVQFVCFGASLLSAIATIKRKLTFAAAKDIESIRAMSWREFETLIAETYHRQGFTVEETGGGGADGGVDLILRGNGRKVLVQCKQWRAQQVGVKVVREMVGIIGHEKADAVVVVTSGSFTGEAASFARGKPVDLVDGKALVELIRNVRGGAETAPALPPSSPKAAAPVSAPVATTSVPMCPKCGSAMVHRTAKNGANAGNSFWGCSRYPECRGIVSAG
jgi:restriction system protein